MQLIFRFTLGLLCFLWSLNSYGQGFAMSVDLVNVVYEDIDNPLTIVIANTNCDKIEVTTDNGVMRKNAGRCSYLLTKAKVGVANFIVYQKTGASRKVIDTIRYRVLPFPLPEAMVLGRRNSAVKIAQFRVQLSMPPAYRECAEAGSYPIASFTIDVIRAGSLAFTHDNRSPLFDSTVAKFFTEHLTPGDRVVFRNIKTELSGRFRELESFFIDITT